jgi:hypothetical protein
MLVLICCIGIAGAQVKLPEVLCAPQSRSPNQPRPHAFAPLLPRRHE